jgi:hypothetical protein
MARALENRIARLENSQGPLAGPPLLIMPEPDESAEAAIRRVCGKAGLPPRPPEAGPHLIVVPLR